MQSCQDKMLMFVRSQFAEETNNSTGLKSGTKLNQTDPQ